jgi:hypothetical protein
MEDGKVSAKGLIGAIETDLRVARQLDQPTFMIEAMTAAAIRRSAYKNAVWGLAHGVFAPNDVERLREVLRKADAEPIEFAGTMRGEAAIMLDTLQYIFGPISPGGTPKFNANRCREATGQTMGADRLGLGSRLVTDVAGTAKAILDAHVAASRKIGPTFDEAGLREIPSAMNQMERLNAVTKTLFFNAGAGASRVYLTNVQAETLRRVTQLLVELFAYKNAKGKWPKKLSALDKAVVRRVGEDPFAGKPFRYRLTKEGFLLYSVGPNGKDDNGEQAKASDVGGWDGDLVFWPIPGGDKIVAAGSLIQKQDKDLTPISAIGAGLEGKKISVAAKIKEVSSEPNPRYGRLYVITLEQDGKTVDLVYGSKLAQQLAGAENIKPGKTVRATATVVKELDAFRLELQDAKDLVVEE